MGDPGSIPESGRSPGEGNGDPLQHSCQENPMDGAWWATVHGVAKIRTRLSDFTSLHFILGWGASSHVMRREQEQCVEELQRVECNWSTVREGQSRGKRLRLERQRWGLLGTCGVRTWIFSYVQWRAATWFEKGKWCSLISVLEISLNAVNSVGSEQCQALGTTQVWYDDDLQ